MAAIVVEGRNGKGLQATVTAKSGSNPAPRKPLERPRQDGGQPVQGWMQGCEQDCIGLDHRATPVLAIGVAPTHRHTCSRAPPRQHDAQGARLGQTTQTTAIARSALGRLGGSLPMDMDDLLNFVGLRCHGEPAMYRFKVLPYQYNRSTQGLRPTI
jgi:hypothetical protein